ncbi:MAG: iron-sulfur cluster assembly accessory protein [Sulfuricella sp.]|nr:iron-sulfur cluster assembly accessory protein [Sulfuricella sp.]
MNITVQPKAEAFIRRMLRMGGGSGFRLSVAPGGCSGLSAEFTVEAAPLAGDRVVEIGDIRLYLPEASYVMLDGYIVDFADTPMETGFKFVNPKGGACACSSSSGASVGSGHGMATVNVSSIGRRTPG